MGAYASVPSLRIGEIISNITFLLLQKTHQQVDIPKVSQARPRPLVGGHLQPITYRPPTFPTSFHNRRNDDSSGNVETLKAIRLVHQPAASQQQLFASAFGPQSQLQFITRQPRLLNQQNLLINQQTHLVAQPSIAVNQKLQPVSQQLVSQPQSQFSNYQTQFVNQKLQPIPQQNNQLPQYQFQIANQQSQLVNPQHQLFQPQHPQLVNQLRAHPNQLINYQPFSQAQPVSGFQQQRRTPVSYTPFNFDQRQYQEQQAYNQYLQAKKLQELNNQLARQQNRFDLTNSHNVFG